MAVINLGINFKDAQKEAEEAMAPADPGIYDVQVTGYTPGITKKGQANIRWELTIINCPNPNFNGKKMSHFTNLPDNGNLTGVGFFTEFLEKIGKPWKGTDFDPDACIGSTAKANVSSDGKWNQVDSFV